MHVPDHMLPPAAEALFGVLALSALAWAGRGARDEMTSADRPGSPGASSADRVGLIAAVAMFVFAAQMLNFPILAGTSGHLVGGVLAAVLLGPRVGLLTMSLVLAVQAVVFADGGMAALGVNIVLIAVLPAMVVLGLERLVPAWFPTAKAALGSLVAVPVAATLLGVVLGLASGGAEITTVVAAMLGVHLLIGIAESVIAAVVVASLMALAPNLVWSYRVGAAPARLGGVRPTRPAVLGLSAVALMCAAGLSRLASPHPDGLEFVAEEFGFAFEAAVPPVSALLADYGAVAGLDVGVAGAVGLLLVGFLAWGVSRLALARGARR